MPMGVLYFQLKTVKRTANRVELAHINSSNRFSVNSFIQNGGKVANTEQAAFGKIW